MDTAHQFSDYPVDRLTTESFSENSQHVSSAGLLYPLPLSSQEIAYRALQIRKAIVTMVAHAKSGHPGGALGMADVFATLYFTVAQHRPQQPDWPDRDRILLSNGHICPVLYATLSACRYFPEAELLTFRGLETRLQGHPHLGSLPGVENTSGPLGQGISQATGIATAFKMDNRPQRVFCLTSDGEHQEGQTWEAYQYAAAAHLDNLTVVVDRNHIQIDGYTEQVLPLGSLESKIESFGWQVISVPGHDIPALRAAFAKAGNTQGKPTALVCQTVPGKGVSFMENDPAWHGKPPSEEQAKQALAELSQLEAQLAEKINQKSSTEYQPLHEL